MTSDRSRSTAAESPASIRQRLRRLCLERREGLAPEAHARLSAAVNAALIAAFAQPPAAEIGFCWSVRSEVDLRPAIAHWCARGAGAALPVIDTVRGTLSFRRWTPATAMLPGPFGIPLPQATPAVAPDCLLLPLVAFDAAGFRLGYGGGYFDRTLAAWQPQPLLIGVGFELARVDDVHPQAHDVPVDWIATEAGVFRARRLS